MNVVDRNFLSHTAKDTKEEGKEFYSITYAVPGEVGFCVPRISEDAVYLQHLPALLEAERWVIFQQVNSDMGSLVITYKSGKMSDGEMRSHLASLLQLARDEELATLKSVILSPASQFETQPRQVEERPAIVYQIAHAIPGRVRFYVPLIASDAKYVECLETLLKADPAVTSERVNRDAASVVINYKTDMLRHSRQRVQSIFDAAISHLIRLIQLASDTTITVSNS